MESAVFQVPRAVTARAKRGFDGGTLPCAADAFATSHVGHRHVAVAAAHLY